MINGSTVSAQSQWGGFHGGGAGGLIKHTPVCALIRFLSNTCWLFKCSLVRGPWVWWPGSTESKACEQTWEVIVTAVQFRNTEQNTDWSEGYQVAVMLEKARPVWLSGYVNVRSSSQFYFNQSLNLSTWVQRKLGHWEMDPSSNKVCISTDIWKTLT